MKLSPLQSAAHLPFSPLLPLTYSQTTNSGGTYSNDVLLGPSDTQMSNSMHVTAVHTTHSTHNTHASHATHVNTTASNTHNSNSVPAKPVLTRSVSHNASMESYRQTIAEIISQIRYVCAVPYLYFIVVFCVYVSHLKSG